MAPLREETAHKLLSEVPKITENNLEQQDQKVQKFLGPLRKTAQIHYWQKIKYDNMTQKAGLNKIEAKD